MTLRRALLIFLYFIIVVALAWAIIAAFYSGSPRPARGNNHSKVATGQAPQRQNSPPASPNRTDKNTSASTGRPGSRQPAASGNVAGNGITTTPDTGPGDVVALFFFVSAVASLLHWRYSTRKLYL
ncbi:MAG TPA: hypothetical protein VFN51_01335 [Candidatus Saccharimonadales bacterium]|nr:hypothetical protein [Candidatus Saccharimonadales bacterium]